MYRIFLIWLGKLIQGVSRLRGNGGSALPGLVVERLSSNFLQKTTRRFKNGTVLVTGTNGKTTTTKLIADILTQSGHQVIVNRTGSNMSRGIISALIEQSTWYGRLRGEVGLFEVDEAFVPDVSHKLQPKAMVVLNLLRDQLDRYGELYRTAQLIEKGLAHARYAILNADDSLVSALGQSKKQKQVRYFGAAGHLRQRLPDDASLLHAAKLRAEEFMHLKKRSSVVLTSAKQFPGEQQLVFRYQGAEFETVLPLSGVYNAYNAAAALATCMVLGLTFKQASQDLSSVTPAFGRTERIELGEKAVELLLVKNPAGFNQVISTFLTGSKHLPVLMALNDNFADGRDVSWIWDVDFEPLAGREHEIITTGSRANDLALRLKYAEVKAVSEVNPSRALHDFLEALKPGETGYIVPTYTALLKLRRLLAKKTDIKEIWQ